MFQCGDGLLPEPPGKNSVPSRPSFDGQRGVAFNLMVTRRFVFIDALRGIASLGVVLFHAVASSFGSSSSRFVIVEQRSCGSRVPRRRFQQAPAMEPGATRHILVVRSKLQRRHDESRGCWEGDHLSPSGTEKAPSIINGSWKIPPVKKALSV